MSHMQMENIEIPSEIDVGSGSFQRNKTTRV